MLRCNPRARVGGWLLRPQFSHRLPGLSDEISAVVLGAGASDGQMRDSCAPANDCLTKPLDVACLLE